MEDEEVDVLKRISRDLFELKRYVRFLSTEAISNALMNIAKTPERQQIWRLADGTKSNDEIAKEIKVSLRAVQYFVQEAENAGLLTVERRGYPKRIEDIFPKDWKSWKQPREEGKETKIEALPKEEA